MALPVWQEWVQLLRAPGFSRFEDYDGVGRSRRSSDEPFVVTEPFGNLGGSVVDGGGRSFLNFQTPLTGQAYT